MSPDAIVSISVVVTMQVHMVAVHVGNNAVLFVYKFINEACNSPVQALPTYSPRAKSWGKRLLLIIDNFGGGGV